MIFASQGARCYHNGRRLALLYKEGCVRTLRFRKKGGGAIMMIEYITLAGFVLQVIVVGIAIVSPLLQVPFYNTTFMRQ